MIHHEDFCTTQLNLEGLRIDGTGHLERFKDMPGESGPPPRVVALNARGRRRIYFGAGVDPEAESRVRRLAFTEVWNGHPAFHEALRLTHGTPERKEYLTYTPRRRDHARVDGFAQNLSSTDERLRHFSDGFFGIDYPDVFVVLAEGKVVAAAASSREDVRAAEAWVFVTPAYRRRGLAGHVARAWLRGAQGRGLIPFYSHLQENVASRGLARSLRLTLRFTLASYA